MSNSATRTSSSDSRSNSPPGTNMIRRTYERVSISELKILRSTPTHFICDCPWCEEKYGPHSDGRKVYDHLWVNKDTGLGFCYRCETVVLPPDWDSERAIKSRLSTYKSKTSSLVHLEPVALPTLEDITDRKLLKWLIRRSPYLADFLGSEPIELYQTKLGLSYVPVFVVKINGIPVSYQYRLIDSTQSKYWTKPGVKLFYSPTGLSIDQELDEVTLVEGTFDALGAKYLGYPNPLTIFGSTLTSLQLNVLANYLIPSKINLALDSEELNHKVMKMLKPLLPLSEYEIINFDDGRDPDEEASYRFMNNVVDGGTHYE